mmetsp:Transcript_135352/g.234745  ORF Transcript_135352/g.234745 Transcript_135352/m.234745 type:complete len:348 (-) Transcript_135352:464-1507(-)
MPGFAALSLQQLTRLVGVVWARHHSWSDVDVQYTPGYGLGLPENPTQTFQLADGTVFSVHHDGEVEVGRLGLCQFWVEVRRGGPTDSVLMSEKWPKSRHFENPLRFQAFSAGQLLPSVADEASEAVGTWTLRLHRLDWQLERQCRGILRWAEANWDSLSPGGVGLQTQLSAVGVLAALSAHEGSGKLQDLLLKYTARGFVYLQDDPALLQLPAPLLKSLIEQDGLHTGGDEMKVVELLVRWAEGAPTRRDAMSELLKCVRMPFIPMGSWWDHPREFQYLSAYPVFKQLFDEALAVQDRKRPAGMVEGGERRSRKRHKGPELRSDTPEAIYGFLLANSMSACPVASVP